jgi:hypothetical protein
VDLGEPETPDEADDQPEQLTLEMALADPPEPVTVPHRSG